MQRKIAPLLLLFLVVGVGLALYSLYGKQKFPQEKSVEGLASVQPSVADKSKRWRMFETKSFSFAYPEGWSPKLNTASGVETATLGIPGISGEQMIGFSQTSLDKMKPSNQSGQKLTARGREWVEWILRTSGSASYNFYTRSPKGSGSFGIHVVTKSEDKKLEQQLNAMANTVQFK